MKHAPVPSQQKKKSSSSQKRPSAIPRSPAVSMVNTFSKQLKKPFDPTSTGCRVPDLFSFPTTCYHLHGTEVLKTTATISSGSVLYMPNPTLSRIDLSGLVNSATQVTSPMVAFASNAYVVGATATLDTLLTDYRVVSWGIKISNLQPEMTATGRLIVYLIPAADDVPAYNTLSGNGFGTNIVPFVTGGNTAAQLNSSATLNLPSAFEIAVQDLLHGDLEICGSYVSPRYFDFKATTLAAAIGSGNNYFGDSFLVSSTGGIATATATGSRDTTRMVGGVLIGVYFEGCPISTNVLQVEYIYHLEGSPVISTVASTAVSSSASTAYVGNTAIVEASLSTVAGRKSVNWITKGTDFLNDAYESGKKFLSTPAGQAMTMAGVNMMAAL